MSQLPSVNQSSWDSGRSHISNLSLSEIVFDEEKLDEILPAEFSAASTFIHAEVLEAQPDDESDCIMRFSPTHEQSGSDVSCSVAKPCARSNNDADHTHVVAISLSSPSIPMEVDAGEALQNPFHYERSNYNSARSNFAMSSSLHDDEIMDQGSHTTTGPNDIRENAKHEDYSYPAISSIEENDAFEDVDTASSSHSINSSIATNATKMTSEDNFACSNSTADGRWTRDEHEAFLQGLQVYGREWKKVAQNIPTRTSSQIRSHAQKYFAKLAREEQQRHSTLNRPLASDFAHGEANTAASPFVAPNHSSLTSSAQVLLERILVNPEEVQREVEERLGRLRARYRELQIAIEQRQVSGNMQRSSFTLGLESNSHGYDSSPNRSPSKESSPNTKDVDSRLVNNSELELIPDSHRDDGPVDSSARPRSFSQDEPLHIVRAQNPFIFNHHLQNSMAILRRKRLVPVILSSSLYRTSIENHSTDDRGILNCPTHTFPSPTSSSVDGRTLGNEELIALEVLGGDLRRNSSVENLTVCATHDSSNSTLHQEEESIMASPSLLDQVVEEEDTVGHRISKKRRWSEDSHSTNDE